jgi:hypothetical protein
VVRCPCNDCAFRHLRAAAPKFLQARGIGRSPGASHPHHATYGASNVPIIISQRCSGALACMSATHPCARSPRGPATVDGSDLRRTDKRIFVVSSIRRHQRLFFQQSAAVCSDCCGTVRRMCAYRTERAAGGLIAVTKQRTKTSSTQCKSLRSPECIRCCHLAASWRRSRACF